MNKFLRLLLSVLLFYGFSSHAQTPITATSDARFDIFPKAPEAAAFAKFGSVPVGLTTGVPNISVPIYTIALRGLSVPISINYNSSGIKVDEHATNVGLGWMLQAGGAITSAVYGKPDFSTGGWLFSTDTTPQTGTYPTDWNSISTDLDPEYLYNDTYEFYTRVLQGYSDTQPDVFTANFLGRAIKFYYDQSGNCYLMPYRRVKIELVGGFKNDASGFRITDEHDNIYTFGLRVETVTTSDQAIYHDEHGFAHRDTYYTYYLTNITTPYGDSVRFNYGASQNVLFTNAYSETRSEVRGDCGVAQPSDRQVHSSTTASEALITSIVTSKGDSVAFTYNTADRMDMPGAHSLSNVAIYKINNPSFSKAFSFTYSYWGPTGLSGTPQELQDYYRLRLDNVQETGKTPYVFTYNATMPKRLSMGKDHWGYYNGQDMNTTLMPADVEWGFTTGGIRDPDPTFCMAGILTSVKYPTGGKTDFTYEPNKTYMGKIVDLADPLKEGALASQTAVVNYNFTVPSGARDFEVSYMTPGPHIESLEPRNQFRTIHLMQGATLLQQFSGSNNNESIATLSAGNYSFKLCIDTNNIGVFINLNYRLATEKDTAVVYQNVQLGGLHIKATDDYATDGTIAENTTYDYSLDSDSTKIGMGDVFYPVYHFNNNVIQWDPVMEQFIQCTFKSESSSNQLELTGDWGAAYFTHVKVYKHNKAGSGYTSYDYLPPGGDGVPGWPFPPQVVYDWFNDQLSEQKSINIIVQQVPITWSAKQPMVIK